MEDREKRRVEERGREKEKWVAGRESRRKREGGNCVEGRVI